MMIQYVKSRGRQKEEWETTSWAEERMGRQELREMSQREKGKKRKRKTGEKGKRKKGKRKRGEKEEREAAGLESAALDSHRPRMPTLPPSTGEPRNLRKFSCMSRISSTLSHLHFSRRPLRHLMLSNEANLN
jgi:hypothetical protein